MLPSGALSVQEVAAALKDGSAERQVELRFDTGQNASLVVDGIPFAPRAIDALCRSTDGSDVRQKCAAALARHQEKSGGTSQLDRQYFGGEDFPESTTPAIDSVDESRPSALDQHLFDRNPAPYTPPTSTDRHWIVNNGVIE